MEDRPSLRPAVPPGGPAPLGPWLGQHAFGLAALVVGAIALVVVTLRQAALWSTPDWRLTVPFFVAALVLTAMSLARREGAPALALLGLGLAAVGMVLGWFLVMAIIVAVTALTILILSMVM